MEATAQHQLRQQRKLLSTHVNGIINTNVYKCHRNHMDTMLPHSLSLPFAPNTCNIYKHICAYEA